jgi:glutamine amidotransferase
MSANQEILIIDIGLGNLNSLSKCIEALGFKFKIINKPHIEKNFEKIIFPGVGSYSQAMKIIKNNNWDIFLKKNLIEKKNYFLGICIGMQILSENGFENEISDGLKIVNGSVKHLTQLNCSNKIPHTGWNDISVIDNNILFSGIKNNSDFYFDHSYSFHVSNKKNISSLCNYDVEFVSSINSKNIFGTQFHPEKSADNGKKVLSNFLKL